MARWVKDLVTIVPLLAGFDGRDPAAIDAPVADFSPTDLRELRMAFYVDNGIALADADVSRVLYAAAGSLASEVMRVEEDQPGCLEQAYDLEMKLLGADGGVSLWRYLAQLGSTSVHPLLKSWLEKLEYYRVDLEGFQNYWAQLDRYRVEMVGFLRNYDVILCPVYTQAALPHGTYALEENFRGFSHTMAYNLSGWPAAVVRCGETASGLPIGVQVVARPWREDVALAVASRLEQIFGGWQAPELFKGASVAAIGA
jgi:amidase